jgi:hypothetical protein
MIHDMMCKGSKFENNGKLNYDTVDIMGGHPWCHHLSSSTHSSSQPGGISPGYTTPATTFYKARMSILILSKT